MMKRHVWTVLLATILSPVCGCGSSPSAVPLEVGGAAPPFELTAVGSGQRFVSESLKGDVVVLNFWSTTCSVCLHEVDDLKEIHDSGKATVVGIALDDDGQRVQRAVEQLGIKYPVLLGDQTTFERFDGFSIPYTLVLDRSQVVRKRFFGRMTARDLDDVLQSMGTGESVAMR
jgi:thiol-disulfide isomerase/thioredoxin